MKIGNRDIGYFRSGLTEELTISMKEKVSSDFYTTLTINLRDTSFILSSTRHKKYGINTKITGSELLNISYFWRSFPKRVIYRSDVLGIKTSKSKYFVLER